MATPQQWQLISAGIFEVKGSPAVLTQLIYKNGDGRLEFTSIKTRVGGNCDRLRAEHAEAGDADANQRHAQRRQTDFAVRGVCVHFVAPAPIAGERKIPMTAMIRFAPAFMLLAMTVLLMACSSAAPATPAPTAAPTVDPALLARGKDVYQRAGCTACHAIKGVGTQGDVATDLTNIATVALERINSDEYKQGLQGQPPATNAVEYIEQSIVHPDAYTVLKCPTGPCLRGTMPTNFQTVIRDPGDLKALIAYLSTLK